MRGIRFIARAALTLSDVSYFCYCAILMAACGGGGEAAMQFNVSRGLLQRLRILSSRKGGRKPDAVQPYSIDETSLLEATVIVLIRRAGETAALGGVGGLPEINAGNVETLAR